MLAVVGAFTIAVLATAFGVVFDAWFVHTLYGWFMPVAFASAPTLTMGQIAGVLLVLRAAKGIPIPKKDDDNDKGDSNRHFREAARIMFWKINLSLFTLLIGWCVKAFWL